MKKIYLIPVLLFILILTGFLIRPKTIEKIAFEKKEQSKISITPKISKENTSSTNKKSNIDYQEIELSIIEPKNEFISSNSSILVKGNTVPNAEAFINGIELKADKNGNFLTVFSLYEGDNSILILANDESGNYSEKEITVNYQSSIDSQMNLRTNPIEFRRRMMMRIGRNSSDKSAKLTDVVIKEINGKTFIVSKDSKNYTINISPFTDFRTNYWGKFLISEMSTGDKVNIWGIWTDETKTTMSASLIRDVSIMKRHGVIFGIVKSKSNDIFVIDSKNRGEQTVFFTTNSKFINKNGDKISINDVKKGDKIRVKGLWEKTTKKITEVPEIKDFSI
ncbi:MAG: hypothetical protein Q7K55_09405 [Candidatus Levybacteria bacterium]|nr:hypothetical protein [Candidatus Levybacteria bacterium]